MKKERESVERRSQGEKRKERTMKKREISVAVKWGVGDFRYSSSNLLHGHAIAAAPLVLRHRFRQCNGLSREIVMYRLIYRFENRFLLPVSLVEFLHEFTLSRNS